MTMSKAEKVLVAAIDFGTTFSGYAFSFKHEYESDPLRISTNNWSAGSRGLVSLKTPTTVLLKPDGSFDSFGFDAEDKYSELAEDGIHQDWYYFRRFKMMLHDNKDLCRATVIKDDKGRTMQALKVFSMAINFLKKDLLETLDKTASGLGEDDIHWVLTVPAIWNDSSKQFMREAAEEAGITGCNLTIALEPEAASLFCKHLPVEKMCGSSKNSMYVFSPGKRYLVLDAGGGTVDITVHEVKENGKLTELHKASGGAWGGTKVDEAFRQFLIKIVGNDIMQRFSDEKTADFVDLFREFEIKKRSIKTQSSSKVNLKLPISLKDLFEEDTKECLKTVLGQTSFASKVTWSGDKMRVEPDIFQNLFSLSLDSITEHVKSLLDDPHVQGTDTILMVGGFSESPILQEQVRKKFPSMRVIVPQEAGLAVLKGAVLFGHDPSVISSRVARNTYGVEMFIDFKPDIHPDHKRQEIDGRVKCREVFSRHITVGDALVVGEAQTEKEYIPVREDQTAIDFEIFMSCDKTPTYVTDPGCQKIGCMTVQLPDVVWGRDRRVNVKMIYGETEIKVECMNKKSNEKTVAKVNFLG